MTENSPILEVKNLSVRFRQQGGHTVAVNGLSFRIEQGRTMALVGESGCGKSTTALSILRLLPPTSEISGTIEFNGQNLTTLSMPDLRKIRGDEIAMIFQEPMTSLNPVHSICDQISEAIRHHHNMSYDEARSRALELLHLVKLPNAEKRLDDFPHQLSGGQRQRVMIAMAIAGKPKLLIADEPTTALDATIQMQILELIDELRHELGMAVLLITHDLSIVARWADDVVVMHHGEKLEEIKAGELFEHSIHPYTRGLIGASIRLDQNVHYRKQSLSEIKVTRHDDGRYDYALTSPKFSEKPMPSQDAAPILEVRDLVTAYGMGESAYRAVDGVTMRVGKGETVGLVGESGSGKSTLSKTIMRLIPATEGSLIFQGQDITRLGGKRLQSLRANMQMIFQDPFSSLNPRQSVGDILDIPLRLHRMDNRTERKRRIADVIDRVGLPEQSIHRYPHEFSGGQRQRVGIARALILRPSLLICDEPVSALDVSVQSQILNLLVELKEQFELSYLFISHDLAVVQYISDRIVVMKEAKIVEENSPDQIINHPQHDYTRTLIAAAR